MLVFYSFLYVYQRVNEHPTTTKTGSPHDDLDRGKNIIHRDLKPENILLSRASQGYPQRIPNGSRNGSGWGMVSGLSGDGKMMCTGYDMT